MDLRTFDLNDKLLESKRFENKVKSILENNITIISSEKLKEIYYKIDEHTEKCIKKINEAFENSSSCCRCEKSEDFENTKYDLRTVKSLKKINKKLIDIENLVYASIIMNSFYYFLITIF